MKAGRSYSTKERRYLEGALLHALRVPKRYAGTNLAREVSYLREARALYERAKKEGTCLGMEE